MDQKTNKSTLPAVIVTIISFAVSYMPSLILIPTDLYDQFNVFAISSGSIALYLTIVIVMICAQRYDERRFYQTIKYSTQNDMPMVVYDPKIETYKVSAITLVVFAIIADIINLIPLITYLNTFYS